MKFKYIPLYGIDKFESTYSSQLNYLKNFYIECVRIFNYGDKFIEEYIGYVNRMADQLFTESEQKQLKIWKFDRKLMREIVFNNMPEDILFEGIDPAKLHVFYESVSYGDFE